MLVVDDDAAICELLETVLTRDGCTVDTESDPTQAEARVRAGAYHLLLLDVMMPRQDGLETLRRVRALDRDLAVVMITGFPSIETAVQAMQLDAMDYLRKPFTVEALRDAWPESAMFIEGVAAPPPVLRLDEWLRGQRGA